MPNQQDDSVITPNIKQLTSAKSSVLFIMYGTRLSKRPITSCNTNDELKAKITAAFTNLNKETTEKASRRFGSCLKTMIEANGDFFE